MSGATRFCQVAFAVLFLAALWVWLGSVAHPRRQDLAVVLSVVAFIPYWYVIYRAWRLLPAPHRRTRPGFGAVLLGLVIPVVNIVVALRLTIGMRGAYRARFRSQRIDGPSPPYGSFIAGWVLVLVLIIAAPVLRPWHRDGEYLRVVLIAAQGALQLWILSRVRQTALEAATALQDGASLDRHGDRRV